ncbi:MAG: hypothetical protein K9N21_20295 [Deltaproteobacteria bacterium]|nr:hypothetical protein [Deltaproteobacteria bacterium]
MAYIYPDVDWYTGISEQKKVQPRCPYANVHRCYRYYASLYLLGEANITTKINEEEIKELDSFWAKSDLLPALAEHDTGISGPDGRATGFSNFCPEVSYDIFGLFAVSLHEYADEIDIEAAHRQLGEKAYPNDWRWSWASVSPLHYLQCPAYSQILSAPAPSPTGQFQIKQDQDIIEVKPGFMGISINIRSLFTKISKWWLSKR